MTVLAAMGNTISGNKRISRKAKVRQTEITVETEHAYSDLKPHEYTTLRSNDNDVPLYESLESLAISARNDTLPRATEAEVPYTNGKSNLADTGKKPLPPKPPPKPKLANHVTYLPLTSSYARSNSTGDIIEESSNVLIPARKGLPSTFSEWKKTSASRTTAVCSENESNTATAGLAHKQLKSQSFSSSYKVLPIKNSTLNGPLHSYQDRSVPASHSKSSFDFNTAESIEQEINNDGNEVNNMDFGEISNRHSKSMTNLFTYRQENFTYRQEQIKLQIELNKSQTDLLLAEKQLVEAKTEKLRVECQVARDTKALMDESMCGAQSVKKSSEFLGEVDVPLPIIGHKDKSDSCRFEKNQNVRNLTINQSITNKFGSTAKFGNNTHVGKDVCVGSVDRKKENCTKIATSVVSTGNNYVQDPSEIRGDEDNYDSKKNYEIIVNEA